ncbi:MAG: hypothetical protein D6767_08640 [Candidatus Hydrogenedentota bacterium]|nr:MAG: hypothetical protein D6767_08640 [Candidatus Hydrogenedentota bacterium]
MKFLSFFLLFVSAINAETLFVKPIKQIPFIQYPSYLRLSEQKKYVGSIVDALLQDSLTIQKKAFLKEVPWQEVLLHPASREKIPFQKKFFKQTVSLVTRTQALSPNMKLALAEENSTQLSKLCVLYSVCMWKKIEPASMSGFLKVFIVVVKPAEDALQINKVIPENALRGTLQRIAGKIRKYLSGEKTGYLSVQIPQDSQNRYSVFLNGFYLGEAPLNKIPFFSGPYSLVVYAETLKQKANTRVIVLQKEIQIKAKQTVLIQLNHPDYRKATSAKKRIPTKPLSSFLQNTGCLFQSISCSSLFYISVGSGLASFATGTFFFILREKEKEKLAREVNPTASQIAQSQSLQNSYDRLANIALISTLFFTGMSLYAYLKGLSQPKKRDMTVSYNAIKITSLWKLNYFAYRISFPFR